MKRTEVIGWWLAAGIVCAGGPLGCAGPDKDALTPPQPILAPYPGGEVAWAVVPPRNESGTSDVDVLAIGDALVAGAEEIRGVRCAPLNRTIEAMRVMGLRGLSSAADAQRLAQVMRVDAVVVSSVTAWNPYKPEIGLAVGLYARPGAMAVKSGKGLTSRDLRTQTVDGHAGREPSTGDGPLSQVSEHFDSRNHQVLADMETYGSGRVKSPSALGWRSYAATSGRFTEFAIYRTLTILMEQEWRRVGAVQSGLVNKPDNQSDINVQTNQVVAGQVDTMRPEN